MMRLERALAYDIDAAGLPIVFPSRYTQMSGTSAWGFLRSFTFEPMRIEGTS